jgi:hypothetical protein
MQNIAQCDTESREPEVRVSVTLRLLKSTDRAVEIAAAHRDCSKQQLVEDALCAFLAADAE